jgi:hypothetical protein
LFPAGSIATGFDNIYDFFDTSNGGLLALISSTRTCRSLAAAFPHSLTTTSFERSSRGRFEVSF